MRQEGLTCNRLCLENLDTPRVGRSFAVLSSGLEGLSHVLGRIDFETGGDQLCVFAGFALAYCDHDLERGAQSDPSVAGSPSRVRRRLTRLW